MTAADRDAVLAANGAFYAAFRGGDVAAMDALWAESPGVTCIHPGWDVLVGRDQVMASWVAILGNPGRPRIRADEVRAVVAGDMALVTCRERVAGAQLVATNVFVQQAGAWRMLHHHAGPVPDPDSSTPSAGETVH